MRHKYEALHYSACFDASGQELLDALEGLPFLKDGTRKYLEDKKKDKGNCGNLQIFSFALLKEGFRYDPVSLLPRGHVRPDGSFKEKHWEFVKGLAPWMRDGVILCIEREEDPDHIPGETSFWQEERFYGFRVKDGKAFKLDISMKDIDPDDPPVASYDKG